MRVKCLAQEHNAVPRPGLEPGQPDPESSALTIGPPRLPGMRLPPKWYRRNQGFFGFGLVSGTNSRIIWSQKGSPVIPNI